MNQIITEKRLKRPRHSIYYRSLIDDSGAVVKEEAYDCRILVRENNGKKIICIMDAQGGLRKEATRYVNEELMVLGFGTQRQTAGALQLFHTYCDIVHADPMKMTQGDVTGLKHFLLGITVQPVVGFERTLRKDNTVNQIYGMIKKYVKSHADEGWQISAFSQTTVAHLRVPIGTDVSVDIVREKDVNTLRTSSMKNRVAPKHITPKQMERILNSMIAKKDIAGIVISRLQYSYGLRSGEALGVTEEDIVTASDEKGKTIYKIVLRNRITDRLDQSCKGLYHPKRTDEYKNSLYKQSKWEISISKSMYDQLQDYLRISRSPERKSDAWKKNYASDTLADSVENHIGGANHYVFIGTNGRRISGQTWNNHLKSYFLMNDISVDEGLKTSNCSHRLRHGFAMFHAQYSSHPMTLLELQRALRHASPTTCYIYFTPLPEEELALRNSFLDELETLIPEFECKLQ